MSGGLFAGEATESPELENLQPYPKLPQGTLIEFKVSCAADDPCSGSVQIDHDRRSAPRLNP